MFSYSMSEAGEDSLYHYLYKRIRQDIVEGRVEADERLPSKRSLAANLGVSVVTVENAYAQLLAEGFIYSLPKKGYFVWGVTNQGDDEQERSSGRKSREYQESGRPEKSALNIFADFTSNQADLKSFPFSLWAKITRQVLTERQTDLLTNSPGAGVMELRLAIARMLAQFKDIHVSPEQIVVGAGTDYLYGLLVQLLGFKKKFAVEDPGYSKISRAYGMMGLKCTYVPVGNSFMESLRHSNAHVVHISPSHQFPTGVVMPAGTRYEILSWAQESSDRYIIEDDYDSEFRMTGRPVPTLRNLDTEGKVIYINTFSKTLTSTVRVSYMVLPPSLEKRFREDFSFCSCTVSNLEQYVLARFMDQGHYERHVNRMRNYYRGKRNSLLKTIAQSPLSRIATIREKDSGLHFVLEVRTDKSDEEIREAAKAKKICINALSDYYFEEKPLPHRFVISYSSLDPVKIKRAVDVLCKVIVEK